MLLVELPHWSTVRQGGWACTRVEWGRGRGIKLVGWASEDRHNTGGWLVKVNMTHSRKLARVGCMQLHLIPISSEQHCSLSSPSLLFFFLEEGPELSTSSPAGRLGASRPV